MKTFKKRYITLILFILLILFVFINYNNAYTLLGPDSQPITTGVNWFCIEKGQSFLAFYQGTNWVNKKTIRVEGDKVFVTEGSNAETEVQNINDSTKKDLYRLRLYCI